MNFSLLLAIIGILLAIPNTILAILQTKDRLKNSQVKQAKPPVPASGSHRFQFFHLPNSWVVPLLLLLSAILLTASGVFNIIQQVQIATLTNQIAILHQGPHSLTPAITSTPSPIATSTLPATTTPTASITPTATSTLPATAIPTASITPTSSPTLSDPLQDNSKGFQWQEMSNSDGSCGFVPGKHYLLTGSANQYVPCRTQAPQSEVGNFVYQITMTILSGLSNTGSEASPVGAGPQFRIEASQDNPHYGILFNALGNWSFYVVVNNDGSPLLKPLGGARCGDPCPYFKTGYNQPNIFTIWDVGSKIDIYINGYLLDSLSDTTVTSGFLGVRLNVGASSSSVEFSDLKLWQL